MKRSKTAPENENLKPVIITYGYDRSGHIYMDSYIEITDMMPSDTLKYVELRSQFQMTTFGLFHVPACFTREKFAEILPGLSKKHIEESRVKLTDIVVRLGPDSSLEYLRTHKQYLPLVMGLYPELDEKIALILKEGP